MWSFNEHLISGIFINLYLYLLMTVKREGHLLKLPLELTFTKQHIRLQIFAILQEEHNVCYICMFTVFHNAKC